MNRRQALTDRRERNRRLAEQDRLNRCPICLREVPKRTPYVDAETEERFDSLDCLAEARERRVWEAEERKG